MKRRLFLYTGLLLTLLSMASYGGGVGGGGNDSAAGASVYPRFAYVANSASDTVSIYAVDAQTGQLRPNGYATAGANPESVTVDPSGRYAYVANEGGNTVSQYTIAADGVLSPMAAGPAGRIAVAGFMPKKSFRLVLIDESEIDTDDARRKRP